VGHDKQLDIKKSKSSQLFQTQPFFSDYVVSFQQANTTKEENQKITRKTIPK